MAAVKKVSYMSRQNPHKLTMSNNIYFQQGELYIEQLPVSKLIATYGTPLYIYSQQTILNCWQQYANALRAYPHWLCYAVKANSNIGLLDLLARQGAGFDIVSGGELARCLAAKADARKIVFSGVGKEDWEIEQALAADIGCFNVESANELTQIAAIATAQNKVAPIALRVNPDVDPNTHPYISTGLQHNKFGIPIEQAPALYQQAAKEPSLRITGIACHIGSQITTIKPFIDTLERLLILSDKLQILNIDIHHISVGGGLGIHYHEEKPPTPGALCAALIKTLGKRPVTLLLEPGRSIVGDAGLLATKVIQIKSNGQKQFAIVDAGMNDLIRPALYQAYHDIVAVKPSNIPTQNFDIVGPVCESSDVFAVDRTLSLQVHDYLAILQAGAYGFSMSSHYNSRPKPAEVLVAEDKAQLIRQRETISSLFANEYLLSSQS